MSQTKEGDRILTFYKRKERHEEVEALAGDHVFSK